MRGRDFFDLYSLFSDGITPAYAGKSLCRILRSSHRWDHPRVCGEELTALVTDKFYKGSPPRMRGRVARDSKAVEKRGITPAYAGKRHGT